MTFISQLKCYIRIFLLCMIIIVSNSVINAQEVISQIQNDSVNVSSRNLQVDYSASYGTLKVQAQTFYLGKEEGKNNLDYVIVEILKNQLDNSVYYELFENIEIEDGWIKLDLGKDKFTPLNIGRVLNSDISWLKFNIVDDQEVLPPVIITINAVANALFASVAKETPTGNLFPDISYKPNNIVMVNNHANKFEYISTSELLNKLDLDLESKGYIKTYTDTDTQLSESEVREIINDNYIAGLGYIKTQNNTPLRDSDIRAVIDDTYVKEIINNNYIEELGYIKTDTTLSDDQIGQMGYIKTNTQLSNDQVKEIISVNYLTEVISDNYVESLGYIKVDTQLTDNDIEAMGYIKTDTNTQLTDDDVEGIIDDSYLRSLGYIKMNSDVRLNYNREINELSLGIWGGVDISDLKDNTDEQDLELNTASNILSLTGDLSQVDLGHYLDNTDNQQIMFHEDLGYLSITDGGYVDLVQIIRESGLDDQIVEQFDISNENMLSIAIENGNGVQQVNLNNYLDNTDEQEISYDSQTNIVTLEFGGAVDLSDLQDNTDAQELTKVEHLLRLTRVGNNDSEINLSEYLDNTDDQVISYNPETNIVTLESGGIIDLSALEDNTDRQALSISDNLLSLTRLGTDNSEIDLSRYLDNTDQQDLELDEASNILSLTGDSSSVNLSNYLDNTDNQQVSFNDDSGYLSITNGGDVNLVQIIRDSGLDDQIIEQFEIANNNILSIRIENGNGVQEVDLTSYLDNTDSQDLAINYDTDILSLTGDTSSVDLSQYLDNTDNQNLELVGDQLQLTGDATSVDLSQYLDNTDNQNLELDQNTNILSLTNDNTTVDLSDYMDNTDNQNVNVTFSNGTLTVGIDNGNSVGVSLDNLLGTDDQQISYNDTSNVVTLESGGTINLSDLQDNTDSQDLSLTGTTLSLTGDTSTVDLSAYLDNTDNQEITAFNLSGTRLNLGIEDGNSSTVDLAGLYDEYEGGGSGLVPGNANNYGSQYFLNATGGWSSVSVGTHDHAHNNHDILNSSDYFNRREGHEDKNFRVDTWYHTNDGLPRIKFEDNEETKFKAGGTTEGYCYRFENENGDWIMKMYCEGDVLIVEDLEMGGSISESSDKRLKKNIENLEGTLAKVMQLRGVRYQLKDSNNNEVKIGFIAQELEVLFPEFVSTNNDGYKSVTYSKMGAVLLEAIKELKYENDELKSQLNQFEKRIKDLESKN